MIGIASGKWAGRLVYGFSIPTVALPARAFAAVAAGGALPWDTPLTRLQNDLQGPVAHAITTAAVIGSGIMWSVSDMEPVYGRCRRSLSAARARSAGRSS